MASTRPPLRAPRTRDDIGRHTTAVNVNMSAIATGLSRTNSGSGAGNASPDSGHWSTSSAASLSSTLVPSPSNTTSIIPIVAPSYVYSSPPPGTISFFEPALGSYANEPSSERRGVKKQRKKRSGWGPYQSVLKERSVDFNLTLDIQNLKQEISNMEMFRNILMNKTMIQRHDPEGSLVRIAKEHYRVLRSGFNLSESGRKRAIKEQDQKDWIKSAFDPEVDVGNGAYGVPTLIEQIKLYSVFIKFISMTMTGFDIIIGDDSVLVTTRGIMHFQITRTTIVSMFPHIMSEEWLVAKLVGQEIHADTTMDFYFNSNDKVYRFKADLDYVKTFIDILKDPRDVDILLGRALITDNCMIGITNDDLPPPKSLAVESTSEESDVDAQGQVTFESDVTQSPASPGLDFVTSEEDNMPQQQQHRQSDAAVSPGLTSTASSSSTATSAQAIHSSSKKQKKHKKQAAVVPSTQQQPGPLTPAEHFSIVVKQYFHVFMNGADSAAAVSDLQRGFLILNFSPTVGYGSAVGRQVLEDRWRSLCWCFGALCFRQLSQEPLAYTPMENLYLIQCTAEYAMPITVRTVEQVFPHLFADPLLMDIVVGSTITVSAQLTFWLEKDTGLVASITEQMDFEAAFARIVSHPDDRSFLLLRALPTLYGFVGEVVAAADPSDVAGAGSANGNNKERDLAVVPSSSLSPTSEVQAATSTKMSLNNILG